MNKKAMVEDLFDMLFTILFFVFLLFFLGGFTIHVNSNNHIFTKIFIQRTDMIGDLMTRERTSLYANQVPNLDELKTKIEGCQSIARDEGPFNDRCLNIQLPTLAG